MALVACLGARDGQAAAHSPKKAKLAESHRVESGDTLSRIARRYGCSVHTLRRANVLSEREPIVPGQLLLLPPPWPERSSVASSESVGRPHRGRLRAAKRLRPVPGVHLRRPDRVYGTADVVGATETVLRFVAGLHPDAAVIAVGDLSARRGGPLPGHRSHQSGRDVDLGLLFREAPPTYPEEFVPGTSGALHVAAMWTLVHALAATEGTVAPVERVFLDYELQALVYRHAESLGVEARVLERIFQYPNGRYAKTGLVRHLANHHDHLHVRFACADTDTECR